ncbi:MAG: GDP-mannose 4,6-dehydratase [Candidatus Limnocylindrales bacterium]
MSAIEIVTGAAGQDGSYLTERLLAEGGTVHAVVRPRGSPISPGGTTIGQLHVHELDLRRPERYAELIRVVQPDELFNLAGESSVSASFSDPVSAWETNAHAVEVILEAVRRHSPHTRVYQASSSEMFGSPTDGVMVHDEGSALFPLSPYAAAKAAAHVLCGTYRAAFGIRVACGFLFNHESRRRPATFLTRKVADHVTRLRDAKPSVRARAEPLAVGNLAARRDWGFAPDYVDGMIRVARQIEVRARVLGRPPEADAADSYRDYVLGSGQLHSVWELVDRTFALAGLELDWDRADPDPARWSANFRGTQIPAVRVDSRLFRPADPVAIAADASRARTELGWRPEKGLDHLLKDLLRGGPAWP